MAEIPEQLKEKLKTIELETGFFSHKPSRPRRIKFVFLVAVAIFFAGGLVALGSENHSLSLFLIAFASFQANAYFQEKQVHEMYSNACEIISYYKSHEAKQI